jgi:uncharacterized C2H2 Zn-finger protein
MQSHVPKSEMTFKCEVPLCDKVYPSAHRLRQHVKAAHEVLATPEACPKCGKTFDTKAKLAKHKFMSHSAKTARTFDCDVPKCGKKYRTKQSLQRHNKTEHSGVKPWQCPVCGKGFKSQKGHAKHVKKCTPKGGEVPADASDTEE